MIVYVFTVGGPVCLEYFFFLTEKVEGVKSIADLETLKGFLDGPGFKLIPISVDNIRIRGVRRIFVCQHSDLSLTNFAMKGLIEDVVHLGTLAWSDL